jgi:NAD(P)-dependent dehydrogenase (short-subunit alcohol dehydrogenase family)
MTTFDLDKIPSQKGRIAIVTGANVGLGYETALGLAKKEMTVILACRNIDKANTAKQAILKEVANADLEIIQIDLSKLGSVRKFAKSYLEKHQQLDLLINNAGVMVPPFSLTEDGFELQMAANYFGHFLLTGLLLETILATPNSRVVSLSSIAHRSGKINFDDLQSKNKYSAMRAYSQSKLACLMYGYELQRRLEATGHTSTISTIAHPGASNTNLAQHLPKWAMALFGLLAPLFSHSAKAGAQPSLWAAVGAAEGGDYFGPTGFKEMKGKAGKVDSTSLSKDKEIAKHLWEVSEELTGITYSF